MKRNSNRISNLFLELRRKSYFHVIVDHGPIYGDLIYRQYSMEDIFEATQLKLAFSLRYRIPVQTTVRPLFGVGFTSGYALTSNSPELYFVGTHTFVREFRVNEQGFLVEAGGQAGRIGSWIRYERANGFSKFTARESVFNLWYLTVSFRLK